MTPPEQVRAATGGAALDVVFDGGSALPRGLEAAHGAGALGDRGREHPPGGQVVSLERAADAHAAIESRGVIGKTLLVT